MSVKRLTRAGLALIAAAVALVMHDGVALSAELAKDQTVHFAVGVDDIRTVDPHFSIGTGEFPIYRSVYEALLTFPDGRLSLDDIEPGLSESWKVEADGLTWTFKLRKGVTWHGGYGEFTAEDVKFSIDRVKDPATASPFRPNLDVIGSVTVVDPYTIRIKTTRVYPELPALLVDYQAGFIVSKKAVEAGVDLRTHPIGTGPFMFKEYRPRESFTLVRHAAYWRGKPTIDRVVVHFMSDDSTRELALRSGEVHAIEIPAKQEWVDRLRKAAFEVNLTAPANTFALYFNMSQKPLDDIRVRQALSHAINREELIDFLGKDVARPEYSPLPVGYVGHTDNVPRYPYDPERAKQLLAAAGHGGGLDLSMVISNSNIYLPPMQVIQQQWKKVGVNLDLRVVDHPTYHRLIRENVSPVVIYGAFRYPLTGTVYLTHFYHSSSIVGRPTAVTNFTHYGEIIPGIDALIDGARSELNVEQQKRLWMAAQRKIMEDVVAVPLFTRNYALAKSRTLDLGFEQKSWSFYMLRERSRILAR